MASGMQVFASQISNAPTRILLLENMLKASNLRDPQERSEVRFGTVRFFVTVLNWTTLKNGKYFMGGPRRRYPYFSSLFAAFHGILGK